MADDRKGDGEPFLKRWARRKAASADPATAEADSAPTAANIASAEPEGALPAAAPDDDADAADTDLAALPDIDSLDETSDFSVFMGNGIPEELQRRALQKLWRLDPAFSHIDGLLEYGEDFTGSGLAAEAVNTLYKVGKGMRSETDEPETADAFTPDDEPEPAEAAPEAAADAATGETNDGDEPKIATATETKHGDT